MRGARRRRRAGGCRRAAAAGCTSFVGTRDPGRVRRRRRAERRPVPEAGVLPTSAAAPDPDRPRIALDFRLADDLRTVTGTETVVFTPDLPVEELVFRLVPNGPDSVAAGTALVVDDGPRATTSRARRYEAAGGGRTRAALYVVELADAAGGGGDAPRSPSTSRSRSARAPSSGSAPTRASRGGPAAHRCWPGSPACGWALDPFVAGLRGDGHQPGRRHHRPRLRARRTSPCS